MFFEEESKDTHGNMDDYDLNFEQDESVSWDKLLDDNASEDNPLDLLSDEEPDSDTSSADNLLDMDDESFENFIEEIVVTDDEIEIRLFVCPDPVLVYKNPTGQSVVHLYSKIKR